MTTPPSSSLSRRPAPQVVWPLWAKIYAVAIGAPMVGVSLGLSLWVVSTRMGGILDNAAPLGEWLLMIASALSLGIGAFLFFNAVLRLVNGKAEALIVAATAHLIVASPAMTLLMVDFLRGSQESFINDLSNALEDGVFVAEFRLVVWILVHIYLALTLALADNS